VTPNVGYIFGFTVGSGGVLTPLSASPHNMGVGATGLGVHPSAIASDTINGVSYVYVTDSTNGLLISYSVGASDLTRLGASATGNQPSAIVVDPQYLYAYVANSLDGTVSAYTIGSSGTLTSIGSFTAGLQPVAIGIDPSANHFLFTVNFLGNDISDFELSTTTGALTNAQSSPYTANAQPTAVAAIPHGHSSQ
jgi:6-phosphogluconolactonase (cycloisomerase 2 family)